MKYFSSNEINYNSNFGKMSSEAIIYNYGENLYKKFLNNTSLYVLKNKEKKLNELDKIYELKKYYNEIIGIVKNTEYIEGYIIKKIYGLQLSKLKANLNKRIEILKNIKEILKKFKNYNIYYDDLHLNNIFYTNDSIKFIDMDNIIINELKSDVISSLNKKYFDMGGYNINCARIFYFNCMSFEFLIGKSINDSIFQKDLDFLDNNSINLCNNLINYKIGSSADNEYLIDKILIK